MLLIYISSKPLFKEKKERKHKNLIKNLLASNYNIFYNNKNAFFVVYPLVKQKSPLSSFPLLYSCNKRFNLFDINQKYPQKHRSAQC